MEENDPGPDSGDELVDRAAIVPVARVLVPAHVPVAELLDRGQDPRIVHPGAERAAEPGLRVDPGRLDDRRLGLLDVVAQPLVGERVHRGVVVRVVADQVTGGGDAPGELGVRARPAALEEERSTDALGRERLEDSVLSAGPVRSARELRVEGERDLHH